MKRLKPGKRWLYLLLVTAAMLALTVLNMSDLFHVGIRPPYRVTVTTYNHK